MKPLAPLLLVALGCLSCGAAEQYSYEGVAESEPVPQAVTRVNTCPEFGYWVLLPRSLDVGETTEIAVNVDDPDAPRSRLSFEWEAQSGAFSDRFWSDTAYTCESVGKQELTLRARDEDDCTSDLRLAVFCLEPKL